MSTIYIPYYGEKSDPETLIDFLHKVESFLGELVETGEDSTGEKIFLLNLHDDMIRAWFGNNGVNGPGSASRFEAARRSVATTPADTLLLHGLSGNRLKFKLAVLMHWADVYNELGGHKWLGKVIGLIDALLENLFTAIGIEGYLKDLNGFILASVKDNE